MLSFPLRLLLCTVLCLPAISGLAQSEQLDTRGREFWLGFMQNASGTQQLSVKIAAEQATTGTVSVPLAGWSAAFSVGANGVVSVAVPNLFEVIGSENVQDLGVRVVSAEPVTVTAVNYQNQTTDATQVLPVSGLGTAYRVDALPGTSTAFPNGSYIFRSEFLIVATADGTIIEVTPSTMTTAGQAPGVPFTVQLDAGQVYQVQALSGLTDLTGTLVRGTAASGACRPFAVFGGSMCAVLSCAACDHVSEQMAPVSTWGTSFHTVPLGNLAAWSYRILANEDNTTVTIDGGAPIVLNAGQSHQVLNSDEAVCISSDRPVSVSQAMQGATCAGSGDPSLLLLAPDERMSTSAQFTTLFSTQAVMGHYVSLVTATGAIGQVQLNGAPVAASAFSTYAGCAGYSAARLFVGAGTHRITSPAGFLAYAYGLASGESYMYGVSSIMQEPMPQDTVICSSDPVTLTAPVPLANAVWTMASDPGTVLATGNSYTFTPDHNDVYRVDGEIAPSGCPQHFEFQVGLPVQPQLNLTANGLATTTVCQFEAVQLGMGSVLNAQWFDLNWSPSAQMSDPAIPNPVAYPAQDTWYKLQVSSPVGCGSAVDSVLVQVNPSDIFSLRTSVADDSICAGNSTLLHAEVERVLYADAFEGAWAPWWASVQGASISDACGSVTGEALYFNGSGARSATAPPIDFGNGGMAHFALKIASGAAPCDDADPGEDVVLEYSPDGTSWTVLATLHEQAFPTFTQVDVAIPALGAAGSAVHLRWRQLSHSGAGQDNWSLDNVLITRYEDPSAQLNWTPASTLSNAQTAQPTATPQNDTWYRAEVVNASGCTYVDSVLVRVAPAFVLEPISDTVRCDASGVQLHAQATSGTGISWAWSPATGLSSSTIADPVATPTVATTYTVTATNEWGCTAQETVELEVSPLQSVAAAVDNAFVCHGEPVELFAQVTSSGPYTISWSPGGAVADPSAALTTASPAATTEFTCTVTDDLTGCVRTAAVLVEVAPDYTVAMTADTTVCTALGMPLQVSHDMPSPFQVQWSPAGNLNADNILSPTILVDTTATYTVTLTDQHGCSASDSSTIAVAFDNLITPVNVSACAGEQLVLDAGFPGSTYLWNTNATTQSIVVSQAGTYTATITDSQACQAITTFYASFHPLPVVDLGPDLALCGVNEHVLDAGNPGHAVLWSTGSTAHQLTVTTTGDYSVTVTTPEGCQASDQVHVAFHAAPVDALQDITVCEDALPVLDAGNPGSTYLWSTAESTQSITPSASGTYSVTVTTPEQCTGTFEAAVVLMPRVAVDLGADQAHCAGTPVQLVAGTAALDYTWSTGETTAAIDVPVGGTYVATATNGYCTDSDTVEVVFHPAPVNVLDDRTACVGEPITFDAGNAGAAHAWSNGDTTQAITVSAPGAYSVTVTNAFGCVATFVAEAAYVELPVVELGADTVLCMGEWLSLDAGNPGSAYAWSTGAASQAISVGSAGEYAVVVDNGHCTRADSVRILFNPVPGPLPVHQLYTCLDDDPHFVYIDAGNPGSSFLWGDGQTTQSINAQGYGWHSVTITNDFGCSLTDSALVNEFCRPTLFIPNTFTPNGDGRNDVWLPVGNNIGSFEIHVFDRWGGVVFHSTDAHTGWDGTAGGQPVPNDVYAFRLTYRMVEHSDGQMGFEQTKLGHVQVLR